MTRRGGVGKLLLVSIAGLAVVGGAGWFFTQSGAETADAVQTADMATATTTTFSIETTAAGELQAKNQIELRSKVERNTVVLEVVPEGSRVKKGDLLLRMNSEELQNDLDNEELELESDRAELLAAENNVEIQKSNNASNLAQAELKLRLAELALKQWKEGDRVKRRQALSLAIDRAERELDRLSDQYERSIQLYERGYMSKNQRDLDELAFIESQANLETAKLNLRIYEDYEHDKELETLQSDVNQAGAELERVERKNEIELANAESNRDSRKRRVLRNEDQVADLKQQIEGCTIYAPSDGLVVYGTTIEMQRNRWSNQGPLQIGRDIRPNELLMVLPDTSEMVAEVRVHESLAGRVRPGQAVEISIDAAGGQVFQGKVESVGVLAETGGWRDPNLREYTVRILLNDTDGSQLKPSMRCDAKIQLGEVQEALAVPVQAVFRDGPVQYVYSPQGVRFKRVPVQVGQTSDTFAEIRAGIEPGTTVLLRTPSPGEVISQPWNTEALAGVGISVDENGDPVRTMPAAYRGGGQGQGGGRAASRGG